MPFYPKSKNDRSGNQFGFFPLLLTKRWQSLLSIGIPVFALGIGTLGGGLALRNYIYNELTPQISAALTKLLQRPVNIGTVQGVELTEIRFGASELPATSMDRDRVTAQSVIVRFNWFTALWTRTIPMDVTLVKPQFHIEQDPDGQWITTKLGKPEPPGWLKQELTVVRLQDATLVMIPHHGSTGKSTKPIHFSQINGTTHLTYAVTGGTLLDENPLEQLNFIIQGKIVDFNGKNHGNLDLSGEFNPVGERLAMSLRGTGLPMPVLTQLTNLPLDMQSGKANTNLETRFQRNQPPNLKGRLSFVGGSVQVVGLPQLITNMNGDFRFHDQKIVVERGGATYAGAPMLLSGGVHLTQGYDLRVHVQPTDISELFKTLEIKTPVSVAGIAKANLKVQGELGNPIFTGTLAAVKPVQIDKLTFNGLEANVVANPQSMLFTRIQASPDFGGQLTGQARVQMGQNPTLLSDLQATGVPGDKLAAIYRQTPNFSIGPISIRMQVTGSLNSQTTLDSPTIPKEPLIPSSTQSPINESNPLQTLISWQAPFSRYPNSGEILLRGHTTYLNNLVARVGGGSLAAEGKSVENQWQALVQMKKINLNQFSNDLRGNLDGQLSMTGNPTSFRWSDIQAQGQLQLSRGLGFIKKPIDAVLAWDGKTIRVQSAKSDSLEARGQIFTQTNSQGLPVMSKFDLAVRGNRYPLESLAIGLPPTVMPRGGVDVLARISGTPSTPTITGQVGLHNLTVNQLGFEPLLQGMVNFTGGRGGSFNLQGQRDRIALTLNPALRPQFFSIQWDQASIIGRPQGDRLAVVMNQFPITALGLKVPISSSTAIPGLNQLKSSASLSSTRSLPLGGTLSAQFNINPNLLNGTGSIKIMNPTLGYVRGDQFMANFLFAQDWFKLSQGELKIGNSLYAMNGEWRQGGDGIFTAQVEAKQGTVEDVFTAFQWFDFADLTRGLEHPVFNGKAVMVAPNAIDVSNAGLINQLRRLAEIQSLLVQQQERRRRQSPLPELGNLKGYFNGKFALRASLKSGLTVDFDLRGKDWLWDNYRASQILASGRFENGILTLTPLRIQTNQSLLAFSGTVGDSGTQSGQLRMEKIPATAVQEFLSLPLNMTGDLNGSVLLSGSWSNPLARGELTLEQGTLNNAPIQLAKAAFGYVDSRLNFDGSLQVSDPEPLVFRGSVPYQLPISGSRSPDNELISLDVKVQNEGLALLNLLTQGQVAWEKGQGEVNLKVTGTTQKPIATGKLTLNNAVIRSQGFSEPMTDVTGSAEFEGDRIRVNGLSAKFSGGSLSMKGTIPIVTVPNDIQSNLNPLSLSMDNLNIDLKGLYRGTVDGLVKLAGSVLEPTVTGQLKLSNGSVFLPTGNPPFSTPSMKSTLLSSFKVDDLKLLVGDRVELVLQPLLTFRGTGELTLNGFLDKLEPDGTIKVQFGLVNLLSTQFSLDRSRANLVRFIPTQGFDPELDIQLKTSAPQVTRLPIQTLNSAEVADAPITNLGALQTIRILVNINGPASQLTQRMTITSSPTRSPAELYSLLGFGGLAGGVNPVSDPLALINFAGTTLFNLGNIQAFIGDALNLSELRIFPTTIPQNVTIRDQDGKRVIPSQTSALDLGAEIGFDLPAGVSFSVLQILTADVPTLFNIRYRLNDNWLIRTSTDLNKEERAVVEYEARF